MKYQHTIPVKGAPNCYNAFGTSTFNKNLPVFKFGWYDKNGDRSRPGGEIWPEAFLQAIADAVRVGFITSKQAHQAVVDGTP